MTIPSHSHSTASQPACMHDHPNWFWWTYLGGGGSGSWNDRDWSLSGRRSNRWKRGDDGRGDLNFDHLLSNSKEVILLWFLCCQRIDTDTGGCRGRRFGDKRTCNTNFTTNSTVTPGVMIALWDKPTFQCQIGHSVPSAGTVAERSD